MLEISLRQLETFVVTAECASFTRAADKLHLTQSTVSTHIQSLEQELDSQLILRGARRKLELTETGRRVYAAAKESGIPRTTIQNYFTRLKQSV